MTSGQRRAASGDLKSNTLWLEREFSCWVIPLSPLAVNILSTLRGILSKWTDSDVFVKLWGWKRFNVPIIWSHARNVGIICSVRVSVVVLSPNFFPVNLVTQINKEIILFMLWVKKTWCGLARNDHLSAE